jgi:hypothetical protein
LRCVLCVVDMLLLLMMMMMMMALMVCTLVGHLGTSR